MRMRRKLAFLSTLLLTACFGTSDEEALATVRSARSGLRVSMQLFGDAEEEISPAATSGLVAGMIVSGVQNQEGSIPPPVSNGTTSSAVGEDTELLTAFVQLLQTDVQGLLNGSSNREAALDTYRASLESHVQRGFIRQRNLEDRQQELEDDESRLERRVRELRNELDNAISEGKSSQAGIISTDIVEKQGQLAAVQAELLVTDRLLQSFDDLLTPLEERLDAINKNRNALVQGVRVIDIPGVEDLGIIEYQNGFPRFRSGSFF